MDRYLINGVSLPGVTTITGQMDKSDALTGWAARMACQYIENESEKFHDGDFLVSPEVLEQAQKEFRNVSSEAMDIGSEVHRAIEGYIKYGKDVVEDVRDEVMQALIAFWDWEKDNNVKWYESEMIVFHPYHCYAGTLDAIAEVGGDVYLIDFKSSKGFYNGYFEQVAGYLMAYEYLTQWKVKDVNIAFNQEGLKSVFKKSYNNGRRVDGIGILRLDKETGKPEWKAESVHSKIENHKRTFIKMVDLYYEAYDTKTRKRRLKNNPRVERFVW